MSNKRGTLTTQSSSGKLARSQSSEQLTPRKSPRVVMGDANSNTSYPRTKGSSAISLHTNPPVNSRVSSTSTLPKNFNFSTSTTHIKGESSTAPSTPKGSDSTLKSPKGSDSPLSPKSPPKSFSDFLASKKDSGDAKSPKSDSPLRKSKGKGKSP